MHFQCVSFKYLNVSGKAVTNALLITVPSNKLPSISLTSFFVVIYYNLTGVPQITILVTT